MSIAEECGNAGGAATLRQPTWLRIRELKQQNNRRLLASLIGTAVVIGLYDVGMVLLG